MDYFSKLKEKDTMKEKKLTAEFTQIESRRSSNIKQAKYSEKKSSNPSNHEIKSSLHSFTPVVALPKEEHAPLKQQSQQSKYDTFGLIHPHVSAN